MFLALTDERGKQVIVFRVFCSDFVEKEMEEYKIAGTIY
jgi:hypothetical protein